MIATAPEIVDIIVEADDWDALDLDGLAQRAARATFSKLDLPANGFQISVLACDDKRIADLNGTFRDKSNATNVLSWPSAERLPESLPQPGEPDDPNELGDIAIAYQTCQREAKEQGKSIEDHVLHLLIHAILHLFGYDHEEDDEATLMESTEIAILSTLGIADPYR